LATLQIILKKVTTLLVTRAINWDSIWWNFTEAECDFWFNICMLNHHKTQRYLSELYCNSFGSNIINGSTNSCIFCDVRIKFCFWFVDWFLSSQLDPLCNSIRKGYWGSKPIMRKYPQKNRENGWITRFQVIFDFGRNLFL
jgi:hypothetical protein